MDYENNFEEWLSESHRQYILAYVEAAQQREATVTAQFLAER